MSIQKRRGYRHEKALADRLGLFRVGTLGREDLHDPNHGRVVRLSVEAKSRDIYPQWFENAHRQAWRNSPPGTVPVVVWHKTAQAHDEDRVDLRLADFEEILAYIEQLEAQLSRTLDSLNEPEQ